MTGRGAVGGACRMAGLAALGQEQFDVITMGDGRRRAAIGQWVQGITFLAAPQQEQGQRCVQ